MNSNDYSEISYNDLLNNSIAAILAAIEIYNKPKMEYRSECFVILLVNAWELLFKAIVLKNGKELFYPEDSHKSGHSLTIFEAMKESKEFFPNSISYKPVTQNLQCLIKFRNNAIHFYNEKGFDTLFYSLAQTSIFNYRDLVREIFQKDVAEEINFSLLPLAFGIPPDPIQFLRSEESQRRPYVSEYIKLISDTTKELESEEIDTGRFLTIYRINLQSMKKIDSSDIIVGVTNEEDAEAPVVTKTVDPNQSHPYRQKDVLEKIGCSLHGLTFTSYTLQAIIWCEQIKENPRYCWQLQQKTSSPLSRYSLEIVSFIKNMTQSAIEECVRKYKEDQRQKRQSKAGSGLN